MKRYDQVMNSMTLKITEEQYNYFKNCISKDSEYVIGKDSVSIYNHFKFQFKFIGYSVVYLIFFIFILNVFYDGGHDDTLDLFRIIITIPAIIGGLGTVFMIFGFLLEGPSVAKQLMEKRKFFESMKLAIMQTRSYSDFCEYFYFKL